MALTPQDIQSQQFHVRFRGFDVDEVDEFLERVAEDYLTAIQENKQLKERLEEMQKDLSGYREQEKSFQKAFVSAQQVADEMTEKRKKEAEQILEDAKQEAEQLRTEARQEITELEKQLDQLSNQKNTIREELRATLTGYLERLDEGLDTSAPVGEDFASSPEAEENEKAEETFTEEMAAEQTGDEEEVEFVADTVEIAESSYTPEADAAEKEEDDPFFQNIAAAQSDEEEDDLYEKVDLTDDFRLPEEDEFPGYGDEEKSLFSMQENADSGEALPDLEGEMVFSLDDPLDDLAPDIKISDKDAAQG